MKLSRAEQEKADFLAELTRLIDRAKATAHLSSAEPQEALRDLGWFVEENAETVLKAVQRADFRTNEELLRAADEQKFDEDYS